MPNEFMIHVGMESHARLVSEWAHYKSWAEMQADKVESLGRQLDGLRRGLQRLVGAPDVPRLSDAELMIALGHALERVDSDPVGAEQPRGYVEYSRPGGPVEVTVDVSALRVEPRSHVIPLGEPFEGLSPWLAPPQDAPSDVRCAVPVGHGVCGAGVVNGSCPDHGEDVPRVRMEVDVTHLRVAQQLMTEEAERVQQWEAEQSARDDGPATESMPTVEEPPEVDPDYVLGRVFVRGDTIPDDTTTLPRLLVNRQGDEWRYSGSPDPGYPGTAAFYCEEMHAERSFDELLHMHGTLWELRNAAEQDSGQVSDE